MLLIGLARYLLLAAGFAWPWLRRPSPPRYWAKVVAATQGIVLTIVATGWLSRPVASAVTAVALVLLAESFGRQVWWLARHRDAAVDLAPAEELVVGVPGSPHRRSGLGRVLVGHCGHGGRRLVWTALAWPDRLDRLSLRTFVQIPIEGLVLAATAWVLPRRVRAPLAAVAGALIGVLVLLKALDMGYYQELDRAFNPVIEWSSLGPGIGVLRASVGPVRAYAEVAAAALLAVAVVALVAWAATRVARVAPPTGADRPGPSAPWPWCGSPARPCRSTSRRTPRSPPARPRASRPPRCATSLRQLGIGGSSPSSWSRPTPIARSRRPTC